MKILKKGNLPQEKIYKATCGNCGTFFEFERREAKENFDQREGDYLSITCPLKGCGKVVTTQR